MREKKENSKEKSKYTTPFIEVKHITSEHSIAVNSADAFPKKKKKSGKKNDQASDPEW